LELVLRIAVFGIYLGHGAFAFSVKEGWIEYLETVGFTRDGAIEIMPYIGVLDFVVAGVVLLFPIRIVVLWAAIWAFATALMRPISGEPIWDFVERAGNWCAPIALLIVLGVPKTFGEWLTPRSPKKTIGFTK
jgi:hypothetical protein